MTQTIVWFHCSDVSAQLQLSDNHQSIPALFVRKLLQHRRRRESVSALCPHDVQVWATLFCIVVYTEPSRSLKMKNVLQAMVVVLKCVFLTVAHHDPSLMFYINKPILVLWSVMLVTQSFDPAILVQVFLITYD